MIRILFLITAIGCSASRQFKNQVVPTQSPCIDGTIVNIDKHGCESFFWRVNDSGVIKIRCTHSSSKNWWTTSSFYITSVDGDLIRYSTLSKYCEDYYFKIFVVGSRSKSKIAK